MGLAGKVFLLIAAGVGYSAWQAAARRRESDIAQRRESLLTWDGEGGAQPGVQAPTTSEPDEHPSGYSGAQSGTQSTSQFSGYGGQAGQTGQ